MIKNNGEYIGGFIEKWRWSFQDDLTENELLEIYHVCKNKIVGMTSKTDWNNFINSLQKISNFSEIYYKGIKVTEIKNDKIICNKIILKYPEVFKNGLHKSLEDVIKSFKLECEGDCLKKLLEKL